MANPGKPSPHPDYPRRSLLSPSDSAAELWTDGSFEERTAICKGAAMFSGSSNISARWSLTITPRHMNSLYEEEIAGLSLALQHVLSSKPVISQEPIHIFTDSQSLVESIPDLMTFL
jgi:ribonuclease HI